MSVKATYADGVFKPLERLPTLPPGQTYTVFSDEELRDLRETLNWLHLAEPSFDFSSFPEVPDGRDDIAETPLFLSSAVPC